MGVTHDSGRPRARAERRAARRWRTAALTAGALLAGGCAVQDGAYRPLSPEASELTELFWIATWTATGVVVVTAGLMAYAMFHRRREGRESRLRANAFVVVGGFAVPSLILLSMLGFTVDTLADYPDDAAAELEIDVRGYQFWWEAYYPSHDFETANEIHVPVGRTVRLRLTTEDVLHSFWVPELAGKQDMVNGRENDLVFTPTTEGVFRGQCAEYCGLQHAHMAFLVIVESQDEYERWLDEQAAPAVVQDTRGEELFEEHSCAGCHTIRGTEAIGDLGPDLTHFGSRRTIGAATIPNDQGHLMGWIVNSQTVKPGNTMPPITTLSPDELFALTDYLESLK